MLRTRLSIVPALLVAALHLSVAGCYGRISDDADGAKRVDPEEFGLTAMKPSILVFGASWCKPCRHEVPAFNELADRFTGRLQVLGYLVEGDERGSTPSAATAASLGARYDVILDHAWRRFDRLAPPEGRKLPTIVFVDADGRVQSLVQRSMDLETELAPMAERLASGEALTADPEQPASPAATPLWSWIAVSDWLRTADKEISERIEDGWLKGLVAQGFSAQDMAFADGSLRRVASSGTVDRGQWKSSSCDLTVNFDVDGSYVGSTGVCR